MRTGNDSWEHQESGLAHSRGHTTAVVTVTTTVVTSSPK